VELELKRLEFLAERDREGLRSALRLTKTEPEETQQGLKTLAESLERSIGESLRREEEALKEFASSLLRGEGLELELKARVAEKTEYGRLVPKRSFVGSLSGGDFMRKLGPERRREYAEWAKKAGKELVFGNMNAKIVEMWSFADGKRSITEIMEAVTFEYGPTDPELVHEIFKDLERIGYVELASG
jgi:hypothetical protein